MCGYVDRYDVANGRIICSFPMRVRQKDLCVEYNFDIKYQRHVRRGYCCRNALFMLSQVPDSNLGRNTGSLEATAKGSDRLFCLFNRDTQPSLHAFCNHPSFSGTSQLLVQLPSHALTTNVFEPCVTSTFRREVHENCALLLRSE